MLSNDQIIRLIFGFKVRYLRLQKGLSYQELSNITGLSTSYLNDIEKGKRYPKTDKITALALALDVTVPLVATGIVCWSHFNPITSTEFQILQTISFGRVWNKS